jgi:hypothetical protein
MVETRAEVKTFNVYAECLCGGKYNFTCVILDNNGTTDLSDDTLKYKHECDVCGDIKEFEKKYPYQEFMES